MCKTIASLLLLLCLTPLSGAASAQPEITAEPGQVNPYKTRSELLMEATAYTGVSTPEQAAQLWAEGLKMRSAAMQYTVMTDKLQQEYAAQLNRLNSNWVTGMSSPSVQGYTLTETRRIDDAHTEIDLSMEVAATWSPPQFYGAKLWLIREGEFWRIDRLWTHEELYPYTLYRP